MKIKNAIFIKVAKLFFYAFFRSGPSLDRAKNPLSTHINSFFRRRKTASEKKSEKIDLFLPGPACSIIGNGWIFRAIKRSSIKYLCNASKKKHNEKVYQLIVT